MKIFVDSANIRDIEAALDRGFVSGVTTNPSILAKEERGDFVAHVGKIVELLRAYDRPLSLSVEVFSTDVLEMLKQADQFVEAFKYPELSIKVPIGWDELKVIHALRRRGIKVNCTCCMSFNQAMMAAAAGANYVSLFYGRIRDTGYDGKIVIEETARAFRQGNIPSEIIVGSIRHLRDVNEAFLAGAHIVTIPPPFLKQLVGHPKTDEAVQQFITDFRKWMGEGA